MAEAGGKVIGFLSAHSQVLLHHCNRVYEIQEMFTDEAYRSKGIGKMLLDEFEKRLSSIEYDMIDVTSNNKRKQAHAFYEANGYVQTHLKFTKKKA